MILFFFFVSFFHFNKKFNLDSDLFFLLNLWVWLFRAFLNSVGSNISVLSSDQSLIFGFVWDFFFFFLLFPVFPSWNWIIFEGGFLAVSESGGWSFRIVERGHTFLDCMALNFLDKGLWLRIRLGFILALFLVVVVALDLHVWVIAGGPLPLCGGSQKFSSFFFFLLSLAFCLDFCLRNVFVELLKRSVA